MIAMFAALALMAAASAREASPVENGGVDLLPGRSLMGRLSERGMRRLYPVQAVRNGVSGRATLACMVAPRGLVHSCRVESETPERHGFAEASLEAASHYQFAPARDADAGDAPVRIPFVWKAERAAAYVLRPVWLKQPGRADIDAAYPRETGDRGGVAELECRVAMNGGLEACKVLLASSPADAVGRAAVGLAERTMRMTVTDASGMDTPGRLFQTQVSFPDRSPNAPPPLMIGPVRDRDPRQPLPPVSATSLQPSPPPRSPIIMAPDWVRRPTAEDIAANYPPAAREAGVEGHATIICKVRANGTLELCSVVSESRQGLGFGDASLRLVKLFKMKPTQRNGAFVDGGTIRIPFVWTSPK